jgi:hypothetical protein
MKEKKPEAIEKVRWEMPIAPQEATIAKRCAPVLAQARSIKAISSEDHFLAAGAIIPRLDEATKWIEAVATPFVQALDKLHKLGVKFKKAQLEPLETEKQRLFNLRATFRQKQEAAQAERDRIAQRALQQQSKRELLSAAKVAEKSGDHETAQLFREQAITVPAPIINSAPAVPKQEGMYLVERFVFDIVDPDAVPRELCSPDESKIRKVVEALGFKAAIGGVVVRREEKEHSRAVGQ